MENRPYDTDLTDAAWELVKPNLPAALPGGRPRATELRAVVNAIFYVLRTGCQWRLLPHQFPPWGTVYYYLRNWENTGTWTLLHRAIYEQTRQAAGRTECPSVVIMDGQSVKTTERGGSRGFDGHKKVKGRKRHILDLSTGWKWIGVQASYGNGFLDTLEHRQQYKVNALKGWDLGAHKLTFLLIGYYGQSRIPGLVPVDIPNLHDTIDARQRDQTHTG